MNSAFSWIKGHKLIVGLVCFGAFIVPLLVVHCLFKWDLGISWLSAEWSAGDVLGYVAGVEAFFGTVALSSLALWQNQKIHNQHIESLEPILSMKLISIAHVLYLVIENTGSTEAKDIQVSVQSISNNGDITDLMLDELFSTIFELYPKETVQGCVALSGANIMTRTFPQIEVHVSYLRPDINRRKEYNRTVIYNCGYDIKVTADINYDNSQMRSDIDKIARASVRMANYLDGCQVAKFDELDILAGKSLRNDLVEAIKTKENVPVLSRPETIKSAKTGEDRSDA